MTDFYEKINENVFKYLLYAPKYTYERCNVRTVWNAQSTYM